MYIFDILARIE